MFPPIPSHFSSHNGTMERSYTTTALPTVKSSFSMHGSLPGMLQSQLPLPPLNSIGNGNSSGGRSGDTQEILTRAAARSDEPSPVVHPDPDSSIVINTNIPTWRRLRSRDFLPHEVISLVEAIFTNRDGVKVICDLRGGDAQAVTDVIHKVYFAIPPP